MMKKMSANTIYYRSEIDDESDPPDAFPAGGIIRQYSLRTFEISNGSNQRRDQRKHNQEMTKLPGKQVFTDIVHDVSLLL